MNKETKHILTYNVRLEFKSEDNKEQILKILEYHQTIWNFVSGNIFKNKKKKLDRKVIHDKNYKKCRKLVPEAPSQLVIRVLNSVYAAYKAIKSNKKLNELQEPCQLENQSLRLDKRLYKFRENNQIELTGIQCRIRVLCFYSPYPKFQELLSRYSFCDPLLFLKNNEIWLSCSFEVPVPIFIPQEAIGYDLGIKRAFVSSEGNAFQDKQFMSEKRKLRYLKRMLQSKSKGSHSVRTKLNKLSRKEKNKNKNQCHLMSNEMLKTDCNVIVLEDLTGIKKKNRGKQFNNKRSQVPFYKLKEILIYKAPLRGKRVETVNPYMTSQDDYRNHPQGIRKGCRYYAQDNKVFDSDWQAAINIVQKYVQSVRNFKLPISFREPLDGCLNFIGRGLSAPQSSSNRTMGFAEGKPTTLVVGS